MTALLALDRVSKRFGGLQAVNNLSFVIQPGEILGLIGPNGAGKSTLFNLINGVFAPNTGKITFNGIDITGERPFVVARHGLARTHQIVQPLTNMTVLDNCTVGACFGRENLPLHRAREVAREAVHVTGLDDRIDMLALHLTIAGKKRLELARALAAQPKLLLLDEVLAMKQRAAELRAEGKQGAKKADGLQALLDAIAKMAPEDRAVAERVHATVSAAAPKLLPKTWYGMPAYTNEDGKVVLSFKNSGKFNMRYSTLEFQDAANLDDGDVWPVSFAIQKWTPAVEQKVAELVKAAVS